MKITKFLGICVVLLAGGLLIPSAEARSLRKVWDSLTEWGEEVLGDFTFGSIMVDVIRKHEDTGVVKLGERTVTPSKIDLDNRLDKGSSSYQPDWTFYKENNSVHYDKDWLSYIVRAGLHIGRPVGRNILKSTDEGPKSFVQECVPDSLERESVSIAHLNEVWGKLGYDVILSRKGLSKPEDLTDFVQRQGPMEEQRLVLYDPVRGLSEMDYPNKPKELMDFVPRQWPMEEQRLELQDPVRELSEVGYVCMQPMSELMPIDNSGNSN